jgi:predicted amidohydrolase YtcJ
MNMRYGQSRKKYMQPLRTLLENNIPLAIGGDGPMNPFLNIMFAIIHPDNPKEAITCEEAVIAYTLGSAYAENKEQEKGSLKKGKLADLAVLSLDIFKATPEQLPGTRSFLTMLGGKITYEEKDAIQNK